MKEANNRHEPFLARKRRSATRSAPGSSLRRLRSAEESSTKRSLDSIFPLPVLPPLFQETLYQSFFSGAAKRAHRVGRQGNYPRRVTLNDPLQGGVRADLESLSNLRRNRDLSPLCHFCTHYLFSTRQIKSMQVFKALVVPKSCMSDRIGDSYVIARRARGVSSCAAGGTCSCRQKAAIGPRAFGLHGWT